MTLAVPLISPSSARSGVTLICIPWYGTPEAAPWGRAAVTLARAMPDASVVTLVLGPCPGEPLWFCT